MPDLTGGSVLARWGSWSRTIGLPPAVLLALAVPSLILSTVLVALIFLDGTPFDWWLWEQAAARALDGDLFEWGAPSPYGPTETYDFRYSPLYAVIMVPFSALGLDVWRLLHILALAGLPRRVALLTLAFAPFWYDVLHGNVMAFVVVLAYLALAGGRWAAVGYFAMCILVPRPLMLPVAAWLVWRRPESRPIALGFALLGGLTLLYPGYLEALVAANSVLAIDNVAPSAWFGWAWVPIGLGLAAWLTVTGRLGLASLAIMPYWLPYYLMMALIDLTSATVLRSTSPWAARSSPRPDMPGAVESSTDMVKASHGDFTGRR